MISPYAIAATIATSFAFMGGWQVNQLIHDANQKHSIEAAAVAQRELHALEQARSSATLAVQVLARKSEARLRADSAASQSELDSLRTQSASSLRTAASSLAACTAISATYSELLIDSEGRYRALAAKADEHIIDLRVQIETP